MLHLIPKSDGVLVSQATKGGYIFCKYGGVIDISVPTSKDRRGRVQGHGSICPTLTTSNNLIIVTRGERKDG